MADTRDSNDQVVTISMPRRGAGELSLPEGVNQQVMELASRLQARRGKEALPQSGPRATHRGATIAILAGASGASRAAVAEAIAAQAGVPLLTVDLSQAVSKWIGETEKNLQQVFSRAEASGAVLLFDEADALFGRRSDTEGTADRYANLETAYLLQRVQEFEGLVILASNRRDDIDATILQRRDIVLSSSGPGLADRPPRRPVR